MDISRFMGLYNVIIIIIDSFFQSSARFVVGALCPKIKHVDKTPGSTLRKMVENVSSKIMSHVSDFD